MLEGIALVGNPQFAIVDEAYPYISKRLLTDDTPRLRAALRYMIYGRENVFDVDRLIDLLQAFETLEAVRATKTGATAPIRTAAPTDPNSASSVRDALRFFFSPEGEWGRQAGRGKAGLRGVRPASQQPASSPRVLCLLDWVQLPSRAAVRNSLSVVVRWLVQACSSASSCWTRW